MTKRYEHTESNIHTAHRNMCASSVETSFGVRLRFTIERRVLGAIAKATAY